MRYALASCSVLVAAVAVCADSASTIDVPGATVLKVVIKSDVQRDLLARQDATGFVLANMIRIQAGERARTKAFTSTESARLAELESFRSAAENSYLQSLPAQCGGGRDCEERFAYYRCTGAYEFSSEFYRAIFDRFFTAAQQKALAPRLSNAGTVWQGALAMAPNSHPFDGFPAPSRECTKAMASGPTTTAGVSPGQTSAAAAAEAAAADDSVRRARAAGVDVTVLGLTLGQPVQLPQCPQQSLFNLLAPDSSTTCIEGTDALDALAAQFPSLAGGSGPDIPFDLVIYLPGAKCPDWMSGCVIRGHLSNGKLTAVSLVTKGLDVQNEVGTALTQKYRNATQSFWKEWSNEAGKKVYALNMTWNLPGLNVTFTGYAGGGRDAAGSLLIETDAITRERQQIEKARQEQKQKL